MEVLRKGLVLGFLKEKYMVVESRGEKVGCVSFSFHIPSCLLNVTEYFFKVIDSVYELDFTPALQGYRDNEDEITEFLLKESSTLDLKDLSLCQIVRSSAAEDGGHQQLCSSLCFLQQVTREGESCGSCK